ncbi:MAG: amidase domain-containing protein [Actinobacteria bacterium]|nr:amidase domain-containing protein [Actinomycetota bacterium]MCL5888173.1 amidase domain-containing protein [Actinomycetota bacterium]
MVRRIVFPRQLMGWGVVALVAVACVFGAVDRVSAIASEGPRDAVQATVVRYLDARFRRLVTLDSSAAVGAAVDPTDQTAVAEAWGDVEVETARELESGWGDYSLRTEFVNTRVVGTTADVTVRVDVDFHYASSPEVDSGIYNVVHRFRLVRKADDWRIVSIDSDSEEFQRFKQEVSGKTSRGRSARDASDIARRERISNLRQFADQLRPVAVQQSTSQHGADGLSASSVQPLATALHSYSGSRGSIYAQRFAARGTPRWFYYASGANCTNFVSQCVWAAYGGFVPSSDAASRSNITNMVRMVRNVWHGGTGGGMPNWESVMSFWTYVTNSTKTRGPMATGHNNGARFTGINPADVRVGDVLQVRNGSSGNYGHSVYVSVVHDNLIGPMWWDRIFVCQHSADMLNRRADDLIANWGGSNCNMRRLVFRAGTFDR